MRNGKYSTSEKGTLSSGFKHHIKCVTTEVKTLHSTKLRDRKGNESRDESHEEQSPAPYLSTLATSLYCDPPRTLFTVHRLHRAIPFVN